MAAKAKKQAKQAEGDPIQKIAGRISALKEKLAGMKDAASVDPRRRKLKKTLRRAQRRRRRLALFNQRLEARRKGKKPAEAGTPAAAAPAAAEAPAEAPAKSPPPAS